MIPVVKAGEDTSYLTKIVQANAQLWASAYEHVDISHVCNSHHMSVTVSIFMEGCHGQCGYYTRWRSIRSNR